MASNDVRIFGTIPLFVACRLNFSVCAREQPLVSSIYDVLPSVNGGHKVQEMSSTLTMGWKTVASIHGIQGNVIVDSICIFILLKPIIGNYFEFFQSLLPELRATACSNMSHTGIG